MMQPAPDWKQSSQSTLASAEFVYHMLLSEAESPVAAAEILSAVMVRLWLGGAAEDGDLDAMLSSFVDTIKFNVQNLQSTKQ